MVLVGRGAYNFPLYNGIIRTYASACLVCRSSKVHVINATVCANTGSRACFLPVGCHAPSFLKCSWSHTNASFLYCVIDDGLLHFISHSDSVPNDDKTLVATKHLLTLYTWTLLSHIGMCKAAEATCSSKSAKAPIYTFTYTTDADTIAVL